MRSDFSLKISSWHLNGFPDDSNIDWLNSIMSGRSPPLYCTLTFIVIQRQKKKKLTNKNIVEHTTTKRHFRLSGAEGFGNSITQAKPAIIETVDLRVAGWLIGCLFFCVDVIDSAQQ